MPDTPTTKPKTPKPTVLVDAGTSEAAIKDAGSHLPNGIRDASIIVSPPQDSGAEPEIQDSGLTITTDGGDSQPSTTDAGTSGNLLPSTNDVYRGLHPHCFACHSGGLRNYFADINDDTTFVESLVNDPFFVLPGSPESSELYLLLVEQGDPIGSNQMPPYGASFNELSQTGQTEILIEDIYDWILFMEEPHISDGGVSLDSGWVEHEPDAGMDLVDAGMNIIDAGPPSIPSFISVDFSDVILTSTTDPNGPPDLLGQIEADGIMTHKVNITVRSESNLPISNAEVRIVNYLGNMTPENCSVAGPGLTNPQGQIVCEISSEESKDFIFDIQGRSSEAQGWVLLYDNLEISFVECQNARTFYIKEVMGPIFETCVGCHNEYGLVREWPWSQNREINNSPSLLWQGKIEGETGFIDHNLEQLSTLVENYGLVGVHPAPGVADDVPYILAKPAGLVPVFGADEASMPYGHGGGKVLEPGSENFNTFWELLRRVDDNKECPTDNESLFHDPYAGGAEYSATELYHRASFTLTGKFPSPDDYLAILNGSDFNEGDFLDKLSEDDKDTLTEYTDFEDSRPDANAPDDNQADDVNVEGIMYQDAFYERMGEALSDLLLIRDTASDVDSIFSIDNRAFQRRMTFRHRYDEGLTSSSTFACLPEQDFDYDSACNPDQVGLPAFYQGSGLEDETCMIKRGCCEDIGNSDAWNAHVPPIDPSTNTGPRCGQYANTPDAQEATCSQAAGCHVKKLKDSFAELDYDIYAPDGSLIDRTDPDSVLILQWVEQNDSTRDYGYCYTIKDGNTDKERCWHDSDMSWADARGFRSGGPQSDIIIPNTAFFYRYPRRFITLTGGQLVPEVFHDSGRNKLIMPWDCRHDFCANGYEWGNEDLGKQSEKLMEYILRYPNDSDFNNDFRKVLTSSVNVLNPYTAFIFGQNPNDGTYSDPFDRNEWRKFTDIKAIGNMVEELDTRLYSIENGDDPNDINKIFERPMVAGWLTMPTFLDRYPTTPTNLNRMRSKEVHDKFLAIDIMALVNFTVDPNQALPDNPTMNGFSCRVCHAAMDPVGAYFLNYTRNPYTFYDSKHNAIGRIVDDRPDTAENECDGKKEEEECVRTAGYKGSLLAEELMHQALPNLAQQITADDRFSLAVVRWLHESLLGLVPLKPPKDKNNPYYAEMVDAYLAQYHEIERVRTVFVQSGYNLRSAISAILNGRIYRIKKAKFNNEYQKRVYDFAGVGAGQRLIPEQLNRKINDTLGFPWLKAKGDGTYDRQIELLEDHNWYKLMYGGIDNREVVKRDRDPGAVSAAIARKMAVQMACLTVPQEFSYIDPSERRLFRFVDIETNTESDPEAIKEQIQWLFLALYGEYLPLTDVEIGAAYDLFEDIQSNFSGGISCITELIDLNTQTFVPALSSFESCVYSFGYNEFTEMNATSEEVNQCLSNIDEGLAVQGIADTPYNEGNSVLLEYLFEAHDLELIEKPNPENYLLLMLSECSEYDIEGHSVPSRCFANNDFYDGVPLDEKEGRRQINNSSNTTFTIRAWQILLTAMLSDYKYLYE